MAALQAKTKLLSSEPGVCPPDLRGAATADKTHKEPCTGVGLHPVYQLSYPSCYPRRILCAWSNLRKFLSSPFQHSAAAPDPLLHRLCRIDQTVQRDNRVIPSKCSCFWISSVDRDKQCCFMHAVQQQSILPHILLVLVFFSNTKISDQQTNSNIRQNKWSKYKKCLKIIISFSKAE